MLIDSHCHLNYIKSEISVDKIIENSKNKGIIKIITVCTKLSDMSDIKSISKNHKEVYYSVGIHPNEIDEHYNSYYSNIKQQGENIKCVAIGETGLDYYNDKITSKLQKHSFLMHLSIAREIKKPIIVHSRLAEKDTIELLKIGKVQQCGGVMHCFTGRWEMAKLALNLGMYISFSGIVTFKNANDLKYIVKKIPNDRILIETDAPYLAPTPFRGKINYPEYLKYTAKVISQLRGQSFDEFSLITYENTKNCFNLK